jgi:hypothetical protein
MRCKNGIRTLPWPVATAESPLLPPPPPPQDENLPIAKKPRLLPPTRDYTAADGLTTDPPDHTSTDPVTPATSVPSGATACRAHRRSWNAEEDTKLTEAVKKYGNNWGAVAAMVPNRTYNQCRYRWLNSLDHGNDGNKGLPPRNYWELEEDKNLVTAVKKHGYHWTAVAAIVPGRTYFQCRYRWFHHLDPGNGNKGKSPHF